MQSNNILDDFRKIYIEAEKLYDVEIRSECLLALKQYIKSVKLQKKDIDFSFWEDKWYILLAVMMKYLEIHDGKNALKIYNLFSGDIKESSNMLYYLGLIYYENKEYSKMIKTYNGIKNIFYDRENFHFFLGNAYYKLDMYLKAKCCYESALKIRKGFKEARINLDIIKNISHSEIEYYPWKSSIENNGINFKKWPIFINSRDRVNCLKK